MQQVQKFILLYIFFIIPTLSLAQNDFGLKETYSASITAKDTTVKAEVLYGPKMISPKKDIIYYWFSSNKIISTQGAYKGRLLHGEYAVFYNKTNNLKEKGRFENGAKTGEWVSWYSNGLIKESSYWKNGRLNGAFKKYDINGKLIKEGKYSNNLLNGDYYEYKNGKLVQARKYKKGVEITADSDIPNEAVKPDITKPKQKNNEPANKADTLSKKAGNIKTTSNKKVTPK